MKKIIVPSFFAVSVVFAANGVAADPENCPRANFKSGEIISSSEVEKLINCLVDRLNSKPGVEHYQQAFKKKGGIQVSSRSWTSLTVYGPSPDAHCLSIDVGSQGCIEVLVTGVVRNKTHNPYLNVSVGISTSVNMAPKNQYTTTRSETSHFDHSTPYSTQWAYNVPYSKTQRFCAVAAIDPAGEQSGKVLANNVHVGVHGMTLRFTPYVKCSSHYNY